MMSTTEMARSRRANLFARAAGWMACLVIALALVGHAAPAAAAAYVDAATTDVKPEDKVVVAHPQPVQLLFQFKTKGAPNGRATKYLMDQVTDTVKASGLFSDVSTAPVANGAVLSIVIDNVVDPGEMSAAAGKGFVTGATFFVAGTTVKDHYLCTVEYVGGPTAAKITRTATHAVYTQMGLINSPPPNAVKIGGMKEAVLTMTRQIVANPLNAVATDPAFQGAAPSASPMTPAAPAVAASTSAPAASTATTPTTPPTTTAPATPAPMVSPAAPPAAPTPTPHT
jgi:hypothetical protein